MLAHYIEEEGVPTTQVSLIRLHTEKIKPPRALWVSFELGRPLGIPNDPAFQRRILVAALQLFEAPSGPLLEDYPGDAPVAEGEVTQMSCPVSFAHTEIDLGETEQLILTFKQEFVSMRPWYDRAIGQKGRSTVGTSKIPLDDLSGFLCSILEGSIPENPRTDIALPYTILLAANDLKSYYYEVIMAQPSQGTISSRVLIDWFWEETVAGKVLLEIRRVSQKSEDPLIQLVGGLLIVPAKFAP